MIVKDNIEVMIGCDPEFWVSRDGTTPVSAYGLVAGTKKAPQKVRGGAVQVDGMALEFNINPAATFEEFDNNIETVLGEMRRLVPGYQFLFEPVAEFGKKLIDEQPVEARVLGCEPDYNAYTGKANPIPNASTGFRTAAGHLHISWRDLDNKDWPKGHIDPFDPTHMEACKALVKVLDAYVGMISVAYWDNNKRRELYGKAGAFRPKSYGNGWIGLEYRTPSNKWLGIPNARAFMYHNTIDAFKALLNDYDISNKQYSGLSPNDIINMNGITAQRLEEIVTREFENNAIKSMKFYREKAEGKKKAA